MQVACVVDASLVSSSSPINQSPAEGVASSRRNWRQGITVNILSCRSSEHSLLKCNNGQTAKPIATAPFFKVSLVPNLLSWLLATGVGADRS